MENLTQIQANPTVDKRRKALSVVLGQSWGKYSRLRFKETIPAQCRPKNQLPLYAGIRIRVDPYKAVKTLSTKIVESPYVLAIGTQIKNRLDGVVLDLLSPFFDPSHPLTVRRSKINQQCPAWISDDQCINTATIHEFGHVIGISHEQNRSDAVIGGVNGGKCNDVATLNRYIDPPVGALSTDLLIGNIRIDDYDLNSIMNYCNSTAPSALTISATDTLAAGIFYGNMPNLNAPAPDTWKVGTGIMTIRIPSLKIGTIWYSAVLSRITDANRDGLYDNVFTLVKKPIPNNVNVSNYPVTVINGVMNIKMAKRTVISSNYPADGKLAYLGHWELKPLAGTVDKWCLTSNRGDYIAQYPILQGK